MDEMDKDDDTDDKSGEELVNFNDPHVQKELESLSERLREIVNPNTSEPLSRTSSIQSNQSIMPKEQYSIPSFGNKRPEFLSKLDFTNLSSQPLDSQFTDSTYQPTNKYDDTSDDTSTIHSEDSEDDASSLFSEPFSEFNKKNKLDSIIHDYVSNFYNGSGLNNTYLLETCISECITKINTNKSTESNDEISISNTCNNTCDNNGDELSQIISASKVSVDNNELQSSIFGYIQKSALYSGLASNYTRNTGTDSNSNTRNAKYIQGIVNKCGFGPRNKNNKDDYYIDLFVYILTDVFYDFITLGYINNVTRGRSNKLFNNIQKQTFYERVKSIVASDTIVSNNDASKKMDTENNTGYESKLNNRIKYASWVHLDMDIKEIIAAFLLDQMHDNTPNRTGLPKTTISEINTCMSECFDIFINSVNSNVKSNSSSNIKSKSIFSSNNSLSRRDQTNSASSNTFFDCFNNIKSNYQPSQFIPRNVEDGMLSSLAAQINLKKNKEIKNNNGIHPDSTYFDFSKNSSVNNASTVPLNQTSSKQNSIIRQNPIATVSGLIDAGSDTSSATQFLLNRPNILFETKDSYAIYRTDEYVVEKLNDVEVISINMTIAIVKVDDDENFEILGHGTNKLPFMTNKSNPNTSDTIIEFTGDTICLNTAKKVWLTKMKEYKEQTNGKYNHDEMDNSDEMNNDNNTNDLRLSLNFMCECWAYKMIGDGNFYMSDIWTVNSVGFMPPIDTASSPMPFHCFLFQDLSSDDKSEPSSSSSSSSSSSYKSVSSSISEVKETINDINTIVENIVIFSNDRPAFSIACAFGMNFRNNTMVPLQQKTQKFLQMLNCSGYIYQKIEEGINLYIVDHNSIMSKCVKSNNSDNEALLFPWRRGGDSSVSPTNLSDDASIVTNTLSSPTKSSTLISNSEINTNDYTETNDNIETNDNLSELVNYELIVYRCIFLLQLSLFVLNTNYTKNYEQLNVNYMLESNTDINISLDLFYGTQVNSISKFNTLLTINELMKTSFYLNNKNKKISEFINLLNVNINDTDLFTEEKYKINDAESMDLFLMNVFAICLKNNSYIYQIINDKGITLEKIFDNAHNLLMNPINDELKVQILTYFKDMKNTQSQTAGTYLKLKSKTYKNNKNTSINTNKKSKKHKTHNKNKKSKKHKKIKKYIKTIKRKI